MTLATVEAKHSMQRNKQSSDPVVALSQMAIRRFPFAPEMILPLRQGFGAPAKPIVRVGQEVVRGEPIAEPVEFLSVWMHAPATGVIDRIDECPLPSGASELAIYLRVYPGASQEILYGANVDVEALTPRQVIDAVREAGIVGQGGLGIPTHAKLDIPDDQSVDTIVVNGFEPASGMSATRRVLLEHTNAIVLGLRLAMRALGVEKAVLALPSGHNETAAAVRKAIPAGSGIEVAQLGGNYPAGSDKALVQAVLGRSIPEGGLPLDVNATTLHAATLAQVGELLPRKGGLIERVITLAGNGVQRPGNYLVPVGTPLSFALEQVGVSAPPVHPRAAASARLEVPITKASPAIAPGKEG